MIERTAWPRQRDDSMDVNTSSHCDFLTVCGHFVSNSRTGASRNNDLRLRTVRQFVSTREAEQMASRLNLGLPVFRDRWLGIGAVLLVASSVLQAVAAVA